MARFKINIIVLYAYQIELIAYASHAYLSYADIIYMLYAYYMYNYKHHYIIALYHIYMILVESVLVRGDGWKEGVAPQRADAPHSRHDVKISKILHNTTYFISTTIYFCIPR